MSGYLNWGSDMDTPQRIRHRHTTPIKSPWHNVTLSFTSMFPDQVTPSALPQVLQPLQVPCLIVLYMTYTLPDSGSVNSPASLSSGLNALNRAQLHLCTLGLKVQETHAEPAV
jgi:hypothetical protein